MTFPANLKYTNPELPPLRWREHELIGVTVTAILSIAAQIWQILHRPWTELQHIYGQPFYEHNLSFGYVPNVLMPALGTTLLLYLCFLQMNFFVLPRLLQTDAPVKGTFTFRFARQGRIEMHDAAGIVMKRTIVGIVYTLVMVLLLGVGWGLAVWYRQGYEWIATNNLSDSRQIVLGIGLKRALTIVVCYLLYACVREAVISRLTNPAGSRSLRIRLANRVTGYFTIYLCTFWYLYNFDFIDDHTADAFLTWVPPLILNHLSNIFWLFPSKGDKSLIRTPNLRKLLLSTAAWSLPFSIAFSLLVNEIQLVAPLFFTGWIILLFLLTPISWIYYRYRKDSILRFLGMELALDRSEADLQFLRSQINPHFLFNTLNTLYGTALQENALRTAEGVQKLGDMMRFMLHDNHEEKIPMSKEIEYLRNYIDLQRLRTQASPDITITADIDDTGCHYAIAPMLLIPFVENAFKHGISLKERSYVDIRLQCDGKGILFEVRNSVHLRKDNDPEKDRSGVGMKNVVHRLRLIYPDKHEFFVNGNDKEFFIQLLIEPGKIANFE